MARMSKECNHDWNGDWVYISKSGKIIRWYTYRQWAHLDSLQRHKLIHEYHESINDSIVEGGASCSKCGAFMGDYIRKQSWLM